MVTVPMLADFAVRLAFGLIAALALTSWRAVPLRFFRIQSQIALAVLVLGGALPGDIRGDLGGSLAPGRGRRGLLPGDRDLGIGAAVDRDRPGHR